MSPNQLGMCVSNVFMSFVFHSWLCTCMCVCLCEVYKRKLRVANIKKNVLSPNDCFLSLSLSMPLPTLSMLTATSFSSAPVHMCAFLLSSFKFNNSNKNLKFLWLNTSGMLTKKKEKKTLSSSSLGNAMFVCEREFFSSRSSLSPSLTNC